MWTVFGAYITLDNIEATGFVQDSNSVGRVMFQTYNTYDIIQRVYAHGWSHTGTDDASVVFSFGNNEGHPSTGSGVDDSIADGSDTTEDMMQCISGEPSFVYNAVCKYVTNGLEAAVDDVHNSWFGPIETSFMSGAHENALKEIGPANGGTLLLMYNNVVTGSTCSVCGGVVKVWLSQGETNSATGYGFNNVIFDNANGNMINLGGQNAGNFGTWYWFNNTVECGTDSSAGSGAGACGNDGGSPSGMTQVINFENNHWIKADTTAPISCTRATCNQLNPDLTQTVTTANSQGYTSTYGFAPTSASGGTVKTGVNIQSLCTTIAGLNAAAGTVCQNSTGYACTYNTTNHTVSCPNETEIARPAGTAWDIGAYQFISAGCNITPTSIGPYTAGQSVSQQFTASNCSTGTFTISSGSLSGSGLTLSSQGLLSGTAQAGSFSFTVAYGAAADSISVTINAAPSITTSSLPAGQVNVSYSQVLSTSGGTGAVACTLTAGSLPTGVSLTGCTISGTPTTANAYIFGVTPTDGNGVSGSAQALSILINPPSVLAPAILHTTFCGPGASWPGTCTLSVPTTAGSRLVVVYSSYNSAGSTPVMDSITDGGDTFSQLANARSINSNSASSWNDIWSAAGVAAGRTVLTIAPSTSQVGDVYVWEVQYANNVVLCGSVSSNPPSNLAVGAPMSSGANWILLSHLHPAPVGIPTAVSAPFTTDTIIDGMAYAHDMTATYPGTYGPQWSLSTATFATATCAFSAASPPAPPSSVVAISH